MSYGTVQAEKVTTESGFSLGAGNASSFKNRLINGAMAVAQRGTSFSGITTGNPDAYPADRFHGRNVDSACAYTMSQVADAPSGFVYSIKAQVTTATATINNESFIEQILEGYNTLGFAYGTSGAKSITLSFWVKASIAGTYNIWMYEDPGAKAIGSSYTVSSANTWEYVSLTFDGDTASALNTSNGAAMYIRWYLGVASGAIGPLNSTWSSSVTNRMVSGSVQLPNTLNATFQITGCQLEVGTVATSFDVRSYGTELALCQRYYQRTFNYGSAFGLNNNNGTTWYGHGKCHVTMRDVPTASIISGVTPVVDMMSAGNKTWSSGTPIGKTVNSWKWDLAFSGGALGSYYIGVLSNDCIECSAEL